MVEALANERKPDKIFCIQFLMKFDAINKVYDKNLLFLFENIHIFRSQKKFLFMKEWTVKLDNTRLCNVLSGRMKNERRRKDLWVFGSVRDTHTRLASLVDSMVAFQANTKLNRPEHKHDNTCVKFTSMNFGLHHFGDCVRNGSALKWYLVFRENRDRIVLVESITDDSVTCTNAG